MPVTYQRPRILLTTDAVGGVWRYTLSLARGLQRLGGHCTIAVVGPAATESQLADASGLRVLQTGAALDWTARDEHDIAAATRELSHLAAMSDAEIVHLHTPSFVEGRWPCPVVAVVHSCIATWWHAVRGNDVPDDLAWQVRLAGRGIKAAAAVIAPTQALAAALHDVYRPNRQIEVIHNGGEDLGREDVARDNVVLAAGRLWDEAKGIGVLDEAAALSDIPIHAAGPTKGANGATFTPRHLHWLGNLSPAALREAQARAAVVASPALYEPFGLAVLEAAGAATPLVLSDIPSFRELWNDAAIFVEPRNSSAWASALEGMIAAPEHARALGQAARTRAVKYSAVSMVHGTARVHRRILSQTRASPAIMAAT